MVEYIQGAYFVGLIIYAVALGLFLFVFIGVTVDNGKCTREDVEILAYLFGIATVTLAVFPLIPFGLALALVGFVLYGVWMVLAEGFEKLRGLKNG